MDRETWLKFYEEADPAVQDYLLSPLSAEQEDKAQTELGFDNDAWERIMDAIWELVFLKLDRKAFEDRITNASTERDSDEVERIVLQHVVLPLEDMVLWDIEARLQELGADPNEFQSVPRISLRPVSYGAAARRIASNAKISIFNEETVRKLRDVIVSYLKGVRTKEQVLEILQRSQSEGGLGLEMTRAETFLDEMLKFLSTTRVMPEEEYAAWYREYQEEARAEAEETLQEVKEEESEGEPAAEKPIPEEETAPKMRALPRTNNQPLDEAMSKAMEEIGDVVKSEYLQKRLHNLISTRMRGMRNKLQVKDVLKRPDKVGGLELPDQEVERIAAIIETYFQRYHEQVEQNEKQRIQEAQEKQKAKIEERRKKEAAEHEEWYKARVKAGAGDGGSQALLAAMQGQSPAAAEAAGGTGQFAGRRPQMQDIQSPVRLTGLGEELENMSLEQFRRLSNNPDQAAEQILQKLNTLKQESFESWTEGVQAWRRSPLQQMYLKLVAESFSKGKPVTELVEEKRETKTSLPTAEELGAIIDLNGKIHLS